MDSWRLRPFRPDDFEAFHAIVSDFDVVKMLGSWPYPAEPAFTRMRMETPEAKAGQVLVIEVDGKLAGSIGGVGGIGYMLGRGFWGRGVATWAVGEMVARMFNDPALQEVNACVWQGNEASERVLTKNGFRLVGECEDFCKARGETLKYNSFRLTRDQWRA